MDQKQEPKYKAIDGHLVNRATGVAIPSNEPVFVFRARDIHARAVLEAYARMLSPGDHRDAVEKRLTDFSRFADEHPDSMKQPDTVAVVDQQAGQR